MRALPGDKYCATHGGRDKLTPALSQRYDLTDAKMAARITMLNTPEDIYTLRDEIAMVRAMLERHLNRIQTDDELIRATPILNQLMLTLERLVKTSSDIEQRLGELMSREEAMTLARELVKLFTAAISHLPDHQQIVDNVIEGTYEVMSTRRIEG